MLLWANIDLIPIAYIVLLLGGGNGRPYPVSSYVILGLPACFPATIIYSTYHALYILMTRLLLGFLLLWCINNVGILEETAAAR